MVVETRDCPSSALVSDLLLSLLEGLGAPAYVRRIHKKVRDDVLLGTAEIPWRRLPYWLIVRVAARRLFSVLFDDGEAGIDRVYYKFFMNAMLAQVLQDCVGKLHPRRHS